MSIRIVLGILLLSLVATAAIGCARQTKVSEQSPASPSPTPANASTTIKSNASASPKSPIRGVDFGFGGPINYGDVTGDCEEEAMMDQPIPTRGSAIQYRVYIYTLRRDRPKLLWRFEAGDRGDGGLRSVYADRGDLVVELYGRNATAEDPYASSATSVEDRGACCPSYFTRTRYEWRKDKFTRKDESEIVTNPDRDASPRMYRASIDR